MDAVGHFVELLDKDRTFGFKHIDDEFIMDDFMPDIDRRAIFFDGEFDDMDCAINPGAKAARCRNEEEEGRFLIHDCGGP